MKRILFFLMLAFALPAQAELLKPQPGQVVAFSGGMVCNNEPGLRSFLAEATKGKQYGQAWIIADYTGEKVCGIMPPTKFVLMDVKDPVTIQGREFLVIRGFRPDDGYTFFSLIAPGSPEL